MNLLEAYINKLSLSSQNFIKITLNPNDQLITSDIKSLLSIWYLHKINVSRKNDSPIKNLLSIIISFYKEMKRKNK